MAPFTLGSDTGGSIRQPASFVGCVGIKPTYGLTSRSGVVAMISSTDTMGPLTRTVEDAAYVFDVFAGKDELDSTTIERDPAGYIGASSDLTGKKIGLIKEYMGDALDADVRDGIEDAVQKLKAAGADVREISIPSLPLALAAYYIICPAEVSSNLSRYDGQRYGYANPDAADLDQSFTKSRGIGFGKEAKRRIMIGTYVLSSGYYDAYYRKAQLVRTKVINDFNKAFEEVDYLIGPTAPTPAFTIGDKDDPLQAYLADIMTVAVSLAGIPAIVVPAGKTPEGLPVGLQIMAPQRADRQLFGVAAGAEAIL
jgi:aspartyl-tRNA(Asn)/glutamyl-tRNA(Gln) amidotransferase subunit A